MTLSASSFDSKHCESRRCFGTLDADEQCECPCEPCQTVTGKHEPSSYRLYGGGFWFITPNAWGKRLQAAVYRGNDDPALKAAMILYPNAWPIADPVVGQPLHHCGHPRACKRTVTDDRERGKLCVCGCDDCAELNRTEGRGPPPKVPHARTDI
jgi:hypothetical protein